MALVTRRGNPHCVTGWADLVRPGLQVRLGCTTNGPWAGKGHGATAARLPNVCVPAYRARHHARWTVGRTLATFCCVAQVVLANPKTAGVARWIFLALWGHRMRAGDTAALDYVTKVRATWRRLVVRFGRLQSGPAVTACMRSKSAPESSSECFTAHYAAHTPYTHARRHTRTQTHTHSQTNTRTHQVFDNVVVQPRDAREASDVFYRQRIGDVLLTYENEVVLTNQVSDAAVDSAQSAMMTEGMQLFGFHAGMPQQPA